MHAVSFGDDRATGERPLYCSFREAQFGTCHRRSPGTRGCISIDCTLGANTFTYQLSARHIRNLEAEKLCNLTYPLDPSGKEQSPEGHMGLRSCNKHHHAMAFSRTGLSEYEPSTTATGLMQDARAEETLT